jgi:hypothetical protein
MPAHLKSCPKAYNVTHLEHLEDLACHELLPEVIAALDDDGHELPVGQVSIGGGLADAAHLLLPRLLQGGSTRVLGVTLQWGGDALYAACSTIIFLVLVYYNSTLARAYQDEMRGSIRHGYSCLKGYQDFDIIQQNN